MPGPILNYVCPTKHPKTGLGLGPLSSSGLQQAVDRACDNGATDAGHTGESTNGRASYDGYSSPFFGALQDVVVDAGATAPSAAWLTGKLDTAAIASRRHANGSKPSLPTINGSPSLEHDDSTKSQASSGSVRTPGNDNKVLVVVFNSLLYVIIFFS